MPSAVPDRSSDPVTTEIERSRRYRHAFTLIRFTPTPSSLVRRNRMRPQRAEGAGHRRRDSLDELAAAVRTYLRNADVAWSDGSAVFVLLPETDASGADAMLARFRRAAQVIDESDVRVASFPEHGLTHHALHAAVARRKQPAAEPESRPGGASGGGAHPAWLATETIDR
jgi:hypothetical protein